MRDPENKIEDLIKTCKEVPESVMIRKKAIFCENGASEYFGLNTRSEIKMRIGEGMLENPVHQNTKELDTWNGSGPAPLVDAYGFHSGKKYGYIAYYINQKNKWEIKSLKKNDRQDDPQCPLTQSLEDKLKDYARKLKIENKESCDE